MNRWWQGVLVSVAAWCLDRAKREPLDMSDELDIWFEWRFISHNYRDAVVKPHITPGSWARLWSVWGRPPAPVWEWPWNPKRKR